jgi:hypothetical protein
MEPQHARRIDGGRRDFPTANDDVLVARMASGRQTPVQPRKGMLLPRQIFEHRLDDERGAREIRELRCTRMRPRNTRASSAVRMRCATPSTGRINHAQPARNSLVVHVHEDHGESFRGHLLGIPLPMLPATIKRFAQGYHPTRRVSDHISIIVPVFNEAGTVAAMIERLLTIGCQRAGIIGQRRIRHATLSVLDGLGERPG